MWVDLAKMTREKLGGTMGELPREMGKSIAKLERGIDITMIISK